MTNDLWREKLARCVEASSSEIGIESVGFVFLPELVHLLVYPATPDPFSSAADEHWQSQYYPADSIAPRRPGEYLLFSIQEI